MIKKLQRKFISIAALSLLTVIVLLLLSINGIFIYQRDHLLNQRLEHLLEEQASGAPQESVKENGHTEQREDAAPDHKKEYDDAAWLFPQLLGNLKFSSKGCLICVDKNGVVKDVRRDIVETYADETVESLTTSILAAKKSGGWVGSYKYRRQAADEAQTETLIAVVDATSSLHAVTSLLCFSGLIGLAAFLLALLFIVIASGKAISPIADSYEKQKQFVTDAGHELKTPLTAISTHSELARLTFGDSEWFDGIDRQTQKMSKLVADLIALARLDEEQKSDFVEFNLSDTMWAAVDSFEAAAAMQGKTLTSDIGKEIRYCGNEEKLLQLATILLDNALKYCDAGGDVHIRLRKGRRIHLTVTNTFHNAAGFEPQKIFERFYRSDKARSSNGSYGLGLSIAKSIVELHKGSICGKALGNNAVAFEVTL